MQNQIELVREEKRRAGGIGLAVLVSFALHVLFLIWFIHSYQPTVQLRSQPIARYVELIRQNPNDDFVEAPGPAVEMAPLTAPLSDANRKASMPEPTGDRPTTRPGVGGGLYHPPAGSPAAQAPTAAAASAQPQQAAAAAPQLQADATSNDSSGLTYRVQAPTSKASAAIDWRAAIKEVGQVASLGGKQGLDLGGLGGDETGFTAEAGPLSFETRWYDWGDYAQSMVSKIRVQWYGVMPPLVRTGMKGVVTIRFTIQRDGRITDVTIIESSGVPPYDFAARKAIELASPLNPLPKDFPNPSERVTAMFFYNREVGR